MRIVSAVAHIHATPHIRTHHAANLYEHKTRQRKKKNTVILTMEISSRPKSPVNLPEGEEDCTERPTVNGSARMALRRKVLEKSASSKIIWLFSKNFISLHPKLTCTYTNTCEYRPLLVTGVTIKPWGPIRGGAEPGQSRLVIWKSLFVSHIPR